METSSQGTSTSIPEGSCSFQRQSASITRSIVTYVIEFLQHVDRKFKEIAIENVVSHPTWKKHWPSYLKDLGKLKQSEEIMDNSRRGFNN